MVIRNIARDVNDAMEKTEVDDEHAENKNSILCLLKRLANFLQSCNQVRCAFAGEGIPFLALCH